MSSFKSTTILINCFCETFLDEYNRKTNISLNTLSIYTVFQCTVPIHFQPASTQQYSAGWQQFVSSRVGTSITELWSKSDELVWRNWKPLIIFVTCKSVQIASTDGLQFWTGIKTLALFTFFFAKWSRMSIVFVNIF